MHQDFKMATPTTSTDTSRAGEPRAADNNATEFPVNRIKKLPRLSIDQPIRRGFEKPHLRSLEVRETPGLSYANIPVLETRASEVISTLETEKRKLVEEVVTDPTTPGAFTPGAVFYGKFGSLSQNNYLTLCSLRTYHPALCQYKKIYFDFANKLWLVDSSSKKRTLRTLDVPLKLAGCPVYLHYSRLIRWGMDLDPFQQADPRRILDDGIIIRVAELFPLSIGLRMYVWGGLEILFENQKKIDKQTKQGPLPGSLFGFSYSFVVLKIKPSIDFVNAGAQVSTSINELYNAKGCVGLRIRRAADDTDAWTTTTHGWVQLKRVEDYTKWGHKVRNIAANIVDRLKGYGYGRAWGRKIGSSSPIGTKVYVTGENTEMGTITACYDDLIHSRSLPFPYGFQHDLSLITKNDDGNPMPVIQVAENLPRIQPRFANPNEVLASPDVFVAHYPIIYYSALQIMKGHIVQGGSRVALVDGAQYFWQRTNFFSISKAIIWRSEKDDDSVQGASGSALFLGNPSQSECKAVCFQNFEQRIGDNHFWTLDTVRDTLTGNDFAARFKGGFILPADIQDATIVVETTLERRRSVSGKHGQSSHASTTSHRSVSNPIS